MDGLVIAAHPYLPQYGYKALSAVLLTASFRHPLPGESSWSAQPCWQVHVAGWWLAGRLVAAVVADSS